MKLRIEKAIYGGDGLARDADGKTIFIPGALPGELVEATVVEDKRSYAQSRLDSVLEPATERIRPHCEYVPRCGGCHYQHAEYPYQLQMKLQILRETLSRARLTVPEKIGTIAGPPWGYRNRIRLHTMKSALAYRQRGSNHLLPVSHCPLAAPLLQEVIPVIARSGIDQLCDEVELFTNGEQLLLNLIPGPHKRGGCLSNFSAQLQAQLPALAGAGLAGEIWGESFVTYTVAEHAYRVSVGSFFQVNRFVLPELLQLAIAWSGSGKLAWDLYSGVGLFAKALAYEHVTAVESAGSSAGDLQHNLAGKAARVVRSGTHEFLRRSVKDRPELVLVDPPRAGMGKETCALMVNVGPASIAYISCDPATLARDLQSLSPHYSIEAMHLVDLFPQTFHMETVTFLRRN
jgi:23S rRNA (uracil1939-C5)-methyltransferase